jgi:hypothetical protein
MLFRVQNTTAADLTWNAHFWYSCDPQLNELASAAVNGSSAWVATTATSGAMKVVPITIPANRTSTVIFVAMSGIPLQSGVNGEWFRDTVAGFVDGSLNLPDGLSFVDDLDTATGGYEQ